jgi:hypothetical protein
MRIDEYAGLDHCLVAAHLYPSIVNVNYSTMTSTPRGDVFLVFCNNSSRKWRWYQYLSMVAVVYNNFFCCSCSSIQVPEKATDDDEDSDHAFVFRELLYHDESCCPAQCFLSKPAITDCVFTATARRWAYNDKVCFPRISS